MENAYEPHNYQYYCDQLITDLDKEFFFKLDFNPGQELHLRNIYRAKYTNVAKKRFDYIDELVQVFENRYNDNHVQLFKRLFSFLITYTFTLPLGENGRLTDERIKYIIKYHNGYRIELHQYLDQFNDTEKQLLIENIIESDNLKFHHYGYEDIYIIMAQLIHHVKLTNDKYDELLNSFIDRGILCAQFLNACMNCGFYPSKEQILNLIKRRNYIPDNYLNTVGLDKGSVEYIAACIEGNQYDVKLNKKTIYNFTDDEKKIIAKAVCSNISIRLKELKAYEQLFKLKYDSECLDILMRTYKIDHHMFQYIVEQGTKPSYETMCTIIRTQSTKNQMLKFIGK